MADSAFIYALLDPVTKQPRYIGQTSRDIIFRAKEHWEQARKNHNFRQWLLSLEEPPEVILLESVPYAYRFIAEQHHTEVLREKGTELLNINSGAVPPPRSEQWRERQRRAREGLRHSLETRAKMSAARLGHEVSDETRAKISAAKKGHPTSAETREKMSLRKKGIPLSAEHRAKISVSLLKRREVQS